MTAYPHLNDPIDREDRLKFPKYDFDDFPAIFQQAIIPMRELEQSGIPLQYVPYLTIGGGIGSFIWVNHLRVYGVRPDKILSIGMEARPYGRYRRLCRQSQIPDTERLRSDSGSTPDNIWGYPGYAMREIVSDALHMRPDKSIRRATKIFKEPDGTDVYTPIAGNVYKAIDREARRINWGQIGRRGRVHAIRQTDRGLYAIFYTRYTSDGTFEDCCVLCRYLYLAAGYPGVRMLPDMLAYRRDTGDRRRAVNAYEAHNGLYDHLRRHGGVVAVRGRGIVASRILQRLYEIRMEQPHIHILHLMRRPIPEGSSYAGNNRMVAAHREIQPYNFPKAAWGGHLRDMLRKADHQERAELLDAWGGTTTSDRRDWKSVIEQGQREGWYTLIFGSVDHIRRSAARGLSLTLCLHEHNTPMDMHVDYLIDATGLETNIQKHSLLNDFIQMYQIPLNVKNRLAVNDTFEIEAMRTSEGRVYAAGAMTFGSTFAPVDSFLGLQYSAQTVMNDMLRCHAPGLFKLRPGRSVKQWTRWMMGVQP